MASDEEDEELMNLRSAVLASLKTNTNSKSGCSNDDEESGDEAEDEDLEALRLAALKTKKKQQARLERLQASEPFRNRFRKGPQHRNQNAQRQSNSPLPFTKRSNLITIPLQDFGSSEKKEDKRNFIFGGTSLTAAPPRKQNIIVPQKDTNKEQRNDKFSRFESESDSDLEDWLKISGSEHSESESNHSDILDSDEDSSPELKSEENSVELSESNEQCNSDGKEGNDEVAEDEESGKEVEENRETSDSEKEEDEDLESEGERAESSHEVEEGSENDEDCIDGDNECGNDEESEDDGEAEEEQSEGDGDQEKQSSEEEKSEASENEIDEKDNENSEQSSNVSSEAENAIDTLETDDSDHISSQSDNNSENSKSNEQENISQHENVLPMPNQEHDKPYYRRRMSRSYSPKREIKSTTRNSSRERSRYPPDTRLVMHDDLIVDQKVLDARRQKFEQKTLVDVRNTKQRTISLKNISTAERTRKKERDVRRSVKSNSNEKASSSSESNVSLEEHSSESSSDSYESNSDSEQNSTHPLEDSDSDSEAEASRFRQTGTNERKDIFRTKITLSGKDTRHDRMNTRRPNLRNDQDLRREVFYRNRDRDRYRPRSRSPHRRRRSHSPRRDHYRSRSPGKERYRPRDSRRTRGSVSPCDSRRPRRSMSPRTRRSVSPKTRRSASPRRKRDRSGSPKRERRRMPQSEGYSSKQKESSSRKKDVVSISRTPSPPLRSMASSIVKVNSRNSSPNKSTRSEHSPVPERSHKKSTNIVVKKTVDSFDSDQRKIIQTSDKLRDSKDKSQKNREKHRSTDKTNPQVQVTFDEEAEQEGSSKRVSVYDRLGIPGKEQLQKNNNNSNLTASVKLRLGPKVSDRRTVMVDHDKPESAHGSSSSKENTSESVKRTSLEPELEEAPEPKKKKVNRANVWSRREQDTNTPPPPPLPPVNREDKKPKLVVEEKIAKPPSKEDELEARIRKIKEKNAAILKRQKEIEADKQKYG